MPGRFNQCALADRGEVMSERLNEHLVGRDSLRSYRSARG
jgi:hypothetical protein